MQHGDEPVGERGEPAQPGLPQGSPELLLPQAQVDRPARVRVHPVRVPPAAAVADREEGSVGRPVDLGDGLVGAAEDGPGPGQPSVGGDLGQLQLGAVPGHPGVVPHQPGRPPAVRGEPGAGGEAVPVVAQLPYGRPVPGRRPVQRYGGQDPAHIGRGGSGELLQHAPHFVAAQYRVGPAQTAARRGHRGEGPRVGGAGRVRLVRVQPLVGEVDEDQQGSAGRPLGPRPGPAAVLGDPAAHVPRCGQLADLAAGAGGAAAHQGAAARLPRPGLGPPHFGADRAEVFGPSVERGREARVDGRGPASVRTGLRGGHHRAPLTGCAARGRGRGRRSGGLRRGPARPRRGRGTSSRSRVAA